MIKGDLRKKQILDTAEKLFTERGYEETGVQDILDVLKLSKGSFYHHFESKELVLRTICEQRASRAVEACLESPEEDGLTRMNQLLSGMIPFHGEGISFLKMLLPVFLLPEGRSVLAGYQEALKKAWLPLTAEALERMKEQKTAFSQYPEKTAGILLDLVNDLWAQVSREMLAAERPEAVHQNASAFLSVIEPYRSAVENMICAPYGTIELLSLENLMEFHRQLRHKS